MNQESVIIYSHDLGKQHEKEIVLERDGEILRRLFIFVDAVPAEMQYTVRLQGRGSRAEIGIAYLGKRKDTTEMDIKIFHEAAETYGRVTAKAALFDDSRFIFRGMLDIGPEAKGADSYLLAKGLMVSPRARAEIYPYLEIRTDEVKASHGSSVGRLDERQLFYLQSRGIAKAEAEKIILSSYFRDVARDMPSEYRKKFFQGGSA
jgi:Fe-S cluster assembly protein SufD